MIERYAKLKAGGVPDFLSGIPNVSNATDEAIKAYAIANGYLPVIRESYPDTFYGVGRWEQNDDSIVFKYAPEPLDVSKTRALQEAQMWISNAVDPRPGVPVMCEELGYEVIYDRQASINMLALKIDGNGASVFIAADDSIHSLTHEEVTIVSNTLRDYVNSLYAIVAKVRADIAAATTPEEVYTATKPIRNYANR